MKKERYHVFLDPVVRAELDAFAKTEGTTRAAEMRSALKLWVLVRAGKVVIRDVDGSVVVL